jgi:kynureninase
MTAMAANFDADKLDATDPLREFRDEFHLPHDAAGRPLVYLCGHSLGLQPRSSARFVNEILDAWRMSGVEGHFSGTRPWVSYHEHLSAQLAALVGATATEVVAMNSLSVNLHLLLASFYRPTRERSKILIEHGAFPSDRYAVRAQIRWHGFDPHGSLIEIAPRQNEATIRQDDLFALIEREGATIATIVLPGIQYLTGQRFDIPGIVSSARKRGCTVGFDLGHAIGNVPLALHDSDVDFAVWCSYKYLNAGPGSIGGAFVHERHARADLPRLAGWWGHDKSTRFSMPDEFSPLAGAEGWQVSNPPVLSMAPLVASLEIFARAGMQRLRDKSLSLTAFLAKELRSKLDSVVRITTPQDPEARGCQLSLIFNEDAAHSLDVPRRLADAGIVCDWREPNVLRVAPVPLYNTYKDARMFVDVLGEILA